MQATFDSAIDYLVNEAEGRDVEDGLEEVVLALACVRRVSQETHSTDRFHRSDEENLIVNHAGDFWETVDD